MDELIELLEISNESFRLQLNYEQIVKKTIRDDVATLLSFLKDLLLDSKETSYVLPMIFLAQVINSLCGKHGKDFQNLAGIILFELSFFFQ